MSRKSSKYKRIDISERDLEELVARMRKGEVLTNDPDMVHDMGKTLLLLSRAFEQKSQTLLKILKAMFAPQTEKISEILKHDQALGNETSEEADHQCPDDVPEGKSKAQLSPQKGTGKNPASAYTGAEKVCICHAELKSGDICPKYSRGKFYDNDPKTIVRVSVGAPVSAKVYELQKLRCNTCGSIFTAEAPEAIGKDKYDSKSKAMIGLLHYGTGLPFNRLDRLQSSMKQHRGVLSTMTIPPQKYWTLWVKEGLTNLQTKRKAKDEVYSPLELYLKEARGRLCFFARGATMPEKT